jgi:hypothetical protein
VLIDGEDIAKISDAALREVRLTHAPLESSSCQPPGCFQALKGEHFFQQR